MRNIHVPRPMITSPHSYPAGGNWSRTAQLRCAVLSLNPRACALEQTSFNIYGNYKTSYTKSI